MRARLIQGMIKAANLLELLVAGMIVLAIVAGGWYLVTDALGVLLTTPEHFSLESFLENSLLLIMGIEFVKMLVLHTTKAVIEVLMFATAREMIVTHSSAFDTLMGVIAVAAIFAIRKCLYTPEFDEPESQTQESM
ncbi:MAG: transporter [Oscillospiraceae bacterium]